MFDKSFVKSAFNRSVVVLVRLHYYLFCCNGLRFSFRFGCLLSCLCISVLNESFTNNRPEGHHRQLINVDLLAFRCAEWLTAECRETGEVVYSPIFTHECSSVILKKTRLTHARTISIWCILPRPVVVWCLLFYFRSHLCWLSKLISNHLFE